jgi:hypothetical protein
MLHVISPKNSVHSGVSFKIFCADLTHQNSGKCREDVVISTARACSISLAILQGRCGHFNSQGMFDSLEVLHRVS